MQIRTVEFTGAIGQIGQAPPEAVAGLPMVAFSGRSNVGKSSLINRLLGRTRSPVARVSSSPGKTQEINFYRVGTDVGEFVLVDLPGYGYARVPDELRQRWKPLIHSFLAHAEGLRGVVQLIDMRHPPTKDDLTSVEYLGELGLPVLFALTKLDKIKPAQRDAHLRRVLDELGVPSDQAVPVSSVTGDGMETLRESLAVLMGPAEASTDHTP